jgi:hypothetical protein
MLIEKLAKVSHVVVLIKYWLYTGQPGGFVQTRVIQTIKKDQRRLTTLKILNFNEKSKPIKSFNTIFPRKKLQTVF